MSLSLINALRSLPSVSVADILTGNFITPASYKSLQPHQILSSTSGMAINIGFTSGGNYETLADFPYLTNGVCSDFFLISTTGNAQVFAEYAFRPQLMARTAPQATTGNCSNSTRMVSYLGQTAGGKLHTEVEYWTFATKGYSTSFGLFSNHGGFRWGASNATYGLFGGGNVSARGSFGGVQNTILYITIATLSNPTSSWGTMGYPSDEMTATQSTTRFVNGANDVAAAYGKTIDLEYGTIGTSGTIANFGDLQSGNGRQPTAASSSTRAIFSGGSSAGTYSVTSSYVTIATTGNASNFGNLITARDWAGANSNGTRMVISGGYTTGGAQLKSMEYYTIASTGTATSFGDMVLKRSFVTTGSNGHGGL